MQDRLGQILLLALVIVIGGMISINIPSAISWNVHKDGMSEVMTQLQYLGIIAILIERSVEVFLNAIGRNGALRTEMPMLQGAVRQAAEKTKNVASAYAVKAGFVIGLILAVSGFRLLETMATPEDHFLAKAAFRGVDVFLTAGLLAGGAALFHEIPEAIRGMLTPLSSLKKPDNS